MAKKPFAQFERWAREQTLTEVADMVSKHEQGRGRKGVTYQAVQDWIKKGVIPAGRVLSVEQVSGIHRSILNPVIYPPEEFELA